MGILDDASNLSGRKAIIVGGADGIGRSITLALSAAGVDVAFCDNNFDALEETRKQIEEKGGRALAHAADAIIPDQLEGFYHAVTEQFGHAHILINVVGGVVYRPFMDKTREDCLEDIQRNYGYVLDSVRLGVPLLRKVEQGGCIINFTTIEAHRGAGGLAVYAGAKAATTNFTRALAWELGPEGIRVNVIAPDTTDSPGNVKALSPEMREMNARIDPQWRVEGRKMYIPLGKPPERDDLANAVLFLASDLAKAITGQVLHVDGGTSAALGRIRWPYDGGKVMSPVPMGPTLAKLFG